MSPGESGPRKSRMDTVKHNRQFREFRRAAAAGLYIVMAVLGGCSKEGAAVGAGATVITASQKEKGFGHEVSDTQISLEINYLWLEESTELFREIGLEVEEGRVLLTGTVDQPEDRITAVRLAWQAEGVQEVINEIEIDETDSFSDFARDGWITAQLKTKILFDLEINAINYSMDTVNQTVYLMGVAADRSELERVIGHAKNIDYVRRVVSYVRLKDDAARAPAATD